MRIVLYPAQSGKVWNGETLDREPLGGSETAVIYVAEELAKLGHEVIVFTRADPGLYKDVLYLPFEEARNILRTLPVDALICSRDAMPLIWTTQAQKRILWLHDMPSGPLPEADAYVCVSNWQANIYAANKFLPQERVRVIGNGIDPSLFREMATADTLKEMVAFAWTSNPERGLWHAAELVQRVRTNGYPLAELHVFGRNNVYGWDGSGEHNFYPKNMESVVLHRARTKAGLAEMLSAVDLWVYPTWWPETYCIAAVEAQAAGVPVVASALGALTETCKTQVLVPGSMRDPGPNHLDAMTDEVLKLLADEKRRKKLAIAGRAYAFTQTWENQAEKWDILLRG